MRKRLGLIAITLVIYSITALVVATFTDVSVFHVIACMALSSAVIQSVDSYYDHSGGRGE